MDDPLPSYVLSILGNQTGGSELDTTKDWVFINYTFKRFEGLTQRGGVKATASPKS